MDVDVDILERDVEEQSGDRVAVAGDQVAVGGPKCADGTTQIPGATCNGSGTCTDDAPVACSVCMDPGGVCTP